MNSMIKMQSLGYIWLMFLLSSCVTINIYFPAAAAEEAARIIVRDVLDKETPEAKPDAKQGQHTPSASGLILISRWLEQLIPAAHAAQPNINIDSPAIKQISRAMQQRHKALQAYFVSGALGFAQNGLVVIRDANALPLRERNKAKKLVADENADRDALYREIARANGYPEWEGQVRNTFAKVWADEAPQGYWYQNANGQWKKR